MNELCEYQNARCKDKNVELGIYEDVRNYLNDSCFTEVAKKWVVLTDPNV